MGKSTWNVLSKWLTLLGIFLFAISSFAINGKTTYQAKIIKPDGQPLQSSSVNFRFTVLDQTGSCVMYVEDYAAINMTDTGGVISFPLGTGLRAFPTSGTAQTFQNTFDNSITSFACQTMGIYNPTPTDSRKILMQFNDGPGWQTLPAMSINAVPYAMYATRANNSLTLNNKADTAFVEYSTIPTCTASQALQYNGVSFTCIAAGGTGGVTSGDITTALGYTPANPASYTTQSDFNVVSGSVATLSSAMNAMVTSVFNLSTSVGAITSSQWATSGTDIFYNTGNVGVGVSAPSVKLHVSGTIRAESAIHLDMQDQFATSVPEVRFRRTKLVSGVASAVNANDRIGAIGAVGFDGIDYSFGQNASIMFKAAENFTPTGYGTYMTFETTGVSTSTRAERMRITASGTVGIGTTTPATKLDISGGIRISMETATCAAGLAGAIRYNAGNLEFCNGTSWSTLGVAGAGITSLNSSTSGSQTFATGITGTVFNISSNNGVHTFNVPLAASGAVTAGLISNADYVAFTNKVSATSAAVISALGYTPASATGLGALASLNFLDLSSSLASGTLSAARLPAHTGDVQSSAGSAVLTLASVGAGVASGTQYTKVTVDGKGRVTSGAQLSSSDVTTALGYSPAQSSSATQWTTSAANIYYNSGNVGVGLTNPTTGKLTVTKTTAAASYALDITGSDPTVGTINRAVNLNMSAGNVNQGNTGIYLHNSGSSEGSATGIELNLNARDSSYGVKINSTKIWNGALFGTVAGVHATVGTDSSLAHSYAGYFTNTASTGTKAYGIYVNADAGSPDAAPLVVAAQSTEVFRVSVSGNVGVGTAAPTARLHLAAGSSTRAPLKFTTGTLLASPQSGTVEYDGTYFYVTDSANSRRALLTDTGGNYAVNHLTSPGNITFTPATGSVIVSATTNSTSSNTGALIVKGGVGVGSDLNVAGIISGSAIVKATGFRAIQGAPDNADSSTVGYSFGQDGDTGIFSPGSGAANGVISIYNNNSETMRINPGSVGIGTSSPSATLHVVAAPAAWGSPRFLVENTGNNGGGQDQAAIGFRALNTAFPYDWEFAGISSTGAFHLRDVASGVTKMIVNQGVSGSIVMQGSGGHVGINNGNPTAPLTVGNSAGHRGYVQMRDDGVNGPVLQLFNAMPGGRVFNIYSGFTTSGTFEISDLSAGNLTRLAIAPSGNVGIGTSTPQKKLHVAGSGASDGLLLDNGTTDSSNLIFHDSSQVVSGVTWNMDSSNGVLRIFTEPIASVNPLTALGGLERMVILPSGNVGIGTTSPQGRMHITAPFVSQDVNSLYNGQLIVQATGNSRSTSQGAQIEFAIPADTNGSNTYGQARILTVAATTNNNDATGKMILGTRRMFDKTGAGASWYYGDDLTIGGNGNIGIGTTSPSNSLTVSGTRGNPSGFANGAIAINGSGVAALLLGTDDTTLGGEYAWIQSHGSKPLHINKVGNSTVINGDSGNVGIGVSAPTSKLQVLSTTNSAWSGHFQNNGSTNAHGLYVNIGPSSTGVPFRVDKNGAEALLVTNDARVSVGGSNPTNKFEVRGGNTFMEGNAYIYGNSGWGSVTPSVTLALGDNDTGIHWIQDGELQIYGNNQPRMHFDIDGRTGIQNTNPQYTLDVSGDFRVTGQAYTNTGAATFTVLSDVRYKDVHGAYERGLDDLLKIGTIRYNYKKVNPTGADSTHEYVGVSAQNVQEAIPEAVEKQNKDGKEFLTVNPSAIIFAMINGFRDMYSKFMQHDREIASLKIENEELKTKVKEFDELKAYICKKDPQAPNCK